MYNPQRAVFIRNFKPLGRQSPTKHQPPCGLRNIDKSTDSCESSPETRYVDVSVLIHLRRTKRSKIQPAAVVEIKLRRLINNCFGIAGRSEAEPTRRNSADCPTFHGKRYFRQQSAFRRHQRNSFRQPDSQIRDRSRL